jgi:energy-converting hydrogenase Eha subunit A
MLVGVPKRRGRKKRSLVSLHHLFSALACLCVVAIVAAALGDYYEYISDRSFAIVGAVSGVLAAIFAAFMPRPLGKEVVGAVDRVLVRPCSRQLSQGCLGETS